MTSSRRSTVLVRTRSRARLRELWAVLDAAGIPAGIEERGYEGRLVVDDEHLERAVAELDDYRHELAGSRQPEAAPLVELPGGWLGILGYITVLMTVNALEHQRAFGIDWLAAGRAQAGALVGGELWRTVTALTLHVDPPHLAGNLLFGTVFGFLAAQALGGGVAWLTIVLAGALGNLLSAALHAPSHSAIGASTAVFAALGVLVAFALRHRRPGRTRSWGPWAPLVAGVLLLAWTGFGGERTDVLAHVTGWASGLLLGLVVSCAPTARLQEPLVQRAAGALALALPVVAWAWAWTVGG